MVQLERAYSGAVRSNQDDCYVQSATMLTNKTAKKRRSARRAGWRDRLASLGSVSKRRSTAALTEQETQDYVWFTPEWQSGRPLMSSRSWVLPDGIHTEKIEFHMTWAGGSCVLRISRDNQQPFADKAPFEAIVQIIYSRLVRLCHSSFKRVDL